LNYSGGNQLLEGEMFISIEDAAKNSKKYKVKVNVEFLRLIIHGFLHLLGYNDLNIKDRIIMKNLEDKLTENLSYLVK
jgi:rRNA maturation RNase YbeY